MALPSPPAPCFTSVFSAPETGTFASQKHYKVQDPMASLPKSSLLEPTSSTSAHSRQAPRSPEQTGLPFLFLVELVSKVLFLRGQVRLLELSSHLKLSTSVIDPLIAFMRTEKLCEAVRR